MENEAEVLTRKPTSHPVYAAFAVALLLMLVLFGQVSPARAEEKAQSALQTQTQEDAGSKLESKSPKQPVVVVAPPGEKTVPIETEKIDKAGEKIGEGVDIVGKKIASVLGPWVNVKLWRGITWLKLLASLSLIALFILIERALSAWLKAAMRKNPTEEKSVLWKRLLLKAIRPPLSLLILVYGTYAGVSPLFKYFQVVEGRNVVHEMAKSLANLGGTIALIWFIYLLVRAADVLMQTRLNAFPKLADVVVKRCRGPIQILIMLVVIRSLMPVFAQVPQLYSILTNLLSLVFIATVAWLITQAVYVASEYFESAYTLKSPNPFYARKLHTQMQFLRRLMVTLIILVAVATSMMIFDKVRQLGTSILASAGIAGVIVGFSAQRTLANLLVGLQIAITQPIRIGDIVTVEKETGTIHDIASTYAIVQTWDQRSLIVPLTYFTEKLFQNLTLASSELLGTVSFFVDYSVPIEEIRAELQRILQESPNWDRRNWALSVAELKESSVELTALMSASDSESLGSLRGEVREKLLAFLQKNFPDGLPRFRAELDVGKQDGIRMANMVLLPRELDTSTSTHHGSRG